MSKSFRAEKSEKSQFSDSPRGRIRRDTRKARLAAKRVFFAS